MEPLNTPTFFIFAVTNNFLEILASLCHKYFYADK
jgi:hypothetical protein